jgi:FkbH-like protein
LANEFQRVASANTTYGAGLVNADLMPNVDSPLQRYHISVLRTFPFEFIAHSLQSYINSWNASFTYQYSDYDPSLNKFEISQETSLVMIWLDCRLYMSMRPKDYSAWVKGRLDSLQQQTDKPIVINNWIEYLDAETYAGGHSQAVTWVRESNYLLQETVQCMHGVHLADLSLCSARFKERIYDYRNDQVVGYPFTAYGTELLAQYLGLQILPVLLKGRLKALILDLDNTLYKGTLAEDGIDEIVLTEGHQTLQRLLLNLKHSGLILAVCSRNQENDVMDLLERRHDFPLKKEDFSVIIANWEEKSDNIALIAERIYVDFSAMLFVDDNPVELFKVKDKLPAIHVLLADGDGHNTKNKLIRYPGIFAVENDELGAKRSEDIKANQIRQRLKEQARSPFEYVKGLDMILVMHENKRSHISRFHELSQKTNQFNVSLRRTESTAAEKMFSSDKHVVLTVELQDRLADSGIIGAVAVSLNGQKAHLLEFMISCRALGRELENIIFYHLILILLERGVLELTVERMSGPRNQPALQWLEGIYGNQEHMELTELCKLLEPKAKGYPAEVKMYGRDCS